MFTMRVFRVDASESRTSGGLGCRVRLQSGRFESVTVFKSPHGLPRKFHVLPGRHAEIGRMRGTNFLAPDVFCFLPVPHGGSFSVAD